MFTSTCYRRCVVAWLSLIVLLLLLVVVVVLFKCDCVRGRLSFLSRYVFST